MEHQPKKITFLFLCIFFLTNCFPAFSSEDGKLSESTGLNWKYHLGKTLIHGLGLCEMFSAGKTSHAKGEEGYETEENLGHILHFCAVAAPFAYNWIFEKKSESLKKEIKNGRQWWLGVGCNAASAVFHYWASEYIFSAGSDFQAARYSGFRAIASQIFGISEDNLKFGLILHLIAYGLNEKGYDLMEESKGMKCTVNISKKFENLCCKKCGRKGNLAEFMKQSRKGNK